MRIALPVCCYPPLPAYASVDALWCDVRNSTDQRAHLTAGRPGRGIRNKLASLELIGIKLLRRAPIDLVGEAVCHQLTIPVSFGP